MNPYLLAFFAATVLALSLTPLAIRIAWAIGFLDRPNTVLKTQRQPVAYLGGLAVALAFVGALFSVKAGRMPTLDQGIWPGSLHVLRGVYAITLGGFIALGLGLLDDKHALSPRAKFLGQIAGAVVLVLCGIRVRFITVPWASIAVTVLWVVTVTNALNFIDIMDGLAASFGLVASLAFLAFALNSGRSNDALAAAALAGACLGFLPYNFQPARIYLGDAGSHFLGFALSAISLNLGYSHQNELAVFSPMAILALPLFDLLLMIVIRTRKGIPPWKGSPDHVPLRLKTLGWSVRRVVLTLAVATAAISSVIYAASFLPLRAALLAWAVFGLAGLALAAWLMSIEMPHDRAPVRSTRKKKR
jgi:UDP-GlcNAc:undecaprenyl-phosphate GlcNAc-1-phosphate transferase